MDEMTKMVELYREVEETVGLFGHVAQGHFRCSIISLKSVTRFN